MFSLLTLFNSILLLILTPILLFVIFFAIIPLLRMRSYQQPGIKKYYYPILGTFGRWFNNVPKYGDIMADSKRLTDYYSPMPKAMVSNMNTRLFFVLNDPQYTKEYLQNSHLYYKSPIIDWARTWVKSGLITAEGEVWKRHRRIVSNAFHFEFLKSNISVIQDTAREFLDKIPKNGCDSYSVVNKMQEITGEVVGRIFFGEDLNSYTFEGEPLTIAFAKIATELSACGWHPLVVLFGMRVIYVPFIPKFRKMVTKMRKFMQLCYDIIEERRSKPQQSNDLLASLLAIQKSEDGDKRLSNVEIVDEFMTFFLAGMDTTGKTIGMTLYMLTKYPEYLKELKEEREAIYNKTDKVTSADVQKMEILHSFIKETFRFYTPAPTPFIRVSASDHMLLDLPIKKGDFLVCDYLAPAHDEKNFENPQKFNPERWRSPEISKLDPFAFIPFSAGPRNCIGQHLALIESKIILSEFLNRFDFKVKDDYKLKMVFKLTYETEEPFYFELSPIKS